MLVCCVSRCAVVQVRELVEQLADAQCRLDKCSHEKSSVTAELELTRTQLSSVDIDYSKAMTHMHAHTHTHLHVSVMHSVPSVL